MAKEAEKGKGKKKKNRKTSEKYKKYSDGKPNQRFCPRCGPGVFLGKHKDRFFCGKCHYAEFSKQ